MIRRKRYVQREREENPKSFSKTARRIFYILDLPPERALIRYCDSTQKTREQAIEELANISKTEEKSIRKCIKNVTSFKYSHSVDDKIKFIKEMYLKQCADSISQKS